VTLLIQNATIITPAPSRDTGRPLRGSAMSELRIHHDAEIELNGTRIARVGLASPRSTHRGVKVIDVQGSVVIPGLVDCHTHLCWAGNRLDEWDLQLQGTPYLAILARGGGIMSTVRAVREATRQQLTQSLLERLDACLAEGTTSVEVKSGYGLSTADELKMLAAIDDAAAAWPGTIVPTALVGHAIDPDRPDFVSHTIRETMLAVHQEFPHVAFDVYIEKNAWTVEDAQRLLQRAVELGHPVRAHVDQFNSLGGVELAIQHGALTADHLEASTEQTREALASSSTVGVGLPVAGVHLNGTCADLGDVVRRGGAVAIATNANPGSAPCFSMSMAAAMGVRRCGLTPAQALVASTLNPARILSLDSVGRRVGVIEAGANADLVVLDAKSLAEWVYQLGGSRVRSVICQGRLVQGHD
jgi:imidazolonepropionase